MRKSKQQDFFKNEFRPGRHTHGGDTTKKKRKLARPIDTRKPLHVVLRASCAKGKLTMLGKNKLKIQELIQATARAQQIKLHTSANVGNHLHLLLSTPTRTGFQKFLKTITGLIARHVTGARRGKPFGQFWDSLAFSSVVSGRRHFLNVSEYIEANQIEGALGKLERQIFKSDPEWYRSQYGSG